MPPISPSQTPFPSEFPLTRDTKFGAEVAPLFDALNGLSGSSLSESSDNWRIGALPLLHEFVDDAKFSDTQFAREDLLFFTANRLGNEIRRVVTHRWIHDLIIDELSQFRSALADSDVAFFDLVASVAYRSGYSRFMNPEIWPKIDPKGQFASLYIDPEVAWKELDELGAGLTLDGALVCSLIERRIIEKVDELEKVVPDFDELFSQQKYRFFTDRGHTTDNLVFEVRLLLSSGIDRRSSFHMRESLPQLIEPTSFMIVEDNPLHHMLFVELQHITGASFFSADNLKTTPHFFTDVHSARLAIHSAVKSGAPLPRVLISDIELSGDGRGETGLDLVESIDSILRAVGRRDEVALQIVYSSNLTFYREQVAALKERGVIADGTLKSQFSLAQLLTTVNQRVEDGALGEAHNF